MSQPPKQPGAAVSYGSLWQVEGSPKRVVTVPCGYADGYFRRMTNQGRVVINGKSYSQVGRICMDQFMVDAGSDEIVVGDEVILPPCCGGGGRDLEERSPSRPRDIPAALAGSAVMNVWVGLPQDRGGQTGLARKESHPLLLQVDYFFSPRLPC